VAVIWFFVRDRAIVSISSRVQISPTIKFGRGTIIKPFSIIQSSGGKVIFGRECRISSFNHIAAGNSDLIVGDHVRTGPHVAIIATSREYIRSDKLISEQGYKDKGIKIGSDVLIGSHAVLDGCTIGDGAVIGVGSVVTGNVLPYTVVFGAPAKIVFARRKSKG
jgi:acetyltransferase-like isoleucine patch superfamily enzyme